MMNATPHDHAMMSLACAQARQFLGATTPNPAVGAVACDSNGNILAKAAHHKAGEGHAEANLLTICRDQNMTAHIHTLYVTLEPCTHHGRTPPCSQAIIDAKIPRVVIGTPDPNPHVAGGGAARLSAAGVETIIGVGEQGCRHLIAAFAHYQTTGKPWITIKRAFDTQGSMLPPKGQKTFTDASSLRLAHLLRKKSDAILTGSGTILADAPLFTIRHIPDYPDKRRFLAIIDRRGRTPQAYTNHRNDAIIYRNTAEALDDLAAKGVQDILVEAGPLLSQHLLQEGLWTMSIDIHQGAPDRIETSFNPKAQILFDTHHYCQDWFLPAQAQEQI